MKKTTHHIPLLLMTIFLLFAWCLDISTSTILMNGTMTNGLWTMNPTIMYHVSLIGMTTTTFTLALYTITRTK